VRDEQRPEILFVLCFFAPQEHQVFEAQLGLCLERPQGHNILGLRFYTDMQLAHQQG
jgi:hypothetical protein